MKTDRGTGGRSAFFGLAMLILGGLLFAAGVMVGRRMALEDSTKVKDPLIKIDQRDQEPKKSADGGELVFPEVLDKEKPEPAPIAPAPEPGVHQPSSKFEGKPEVRVKEPPGQNFSLQVAAYGDRSQADSLVKKLIGQGYENPHIVEREVPGKGIFYRVRVGPYSSKPQADRAKQGLEKDLRVKVMFILED
jgi:cell division septation protein DedD